MSTISQLTHLANYLEQKRQGTIAVISSVAGDRGRASNYVYGSAKAIVTAFTSGLRQSLHDLFLLFFYLPDLHREDPQYRNDSRFLYHDHRMHLLCGSDSGPPALPYHTEGVTMSDERSEMRLFSLTDSSDPRRPWFLADGSAG